MRTKDRSAPAIRHQRPNWRWTSTAQAMKSILESKAVDSSFFLSLSLPLCPQHCVHPHSGKLLYSYIHTRVCVCVCMYIMDLYPRFSSLLLQSIDPISYCLPAPQRIHNILIIVIMWYGSKQNKKKGSSCFALLEVLKIDFLIWLIDLSFFSFSNKSQVTNFNYLFPALPTNDLKVLHFTFGCRRREPTFEGSGERFSWILARILCHHTLISFAVIVVIAAAAAAAAASDGFWLSFRKFPHRNDRPIISHCTEMDEDIFCWLYSFFVLFWYIYIYIY